MTSSSPAPQPPQLPQHHQTVQAVQSPLSLQSPQSPLAFCISSASAPALNFVTPVSSNNVALDYHSALKKATHVPPLGARPSLFPRRFLQSSPLAWSLSSNLDYNPSPDIVVTSRTSVSSPNLFCSSDSSSSSSSCETIRPINSSSSLANTPLSPLLDAKRSKTMSRKLSFKVSLKRNSISRRPSFRFGLPLLFNGKESNTSPLAPKDSNIASPSAKTQGDNEPQYWHRFCELKEQYAHLLKDRDHLFERLKDTQKSLKETVEEKNNYAEDLANKDNFVSDSGQTSAANVEVMKGGRRPSGRVAKIAMEADRKLLRMENEHLLSEHRRRVASLSADLENANSRLAAARAQLANVGITDAPHRPTELQNNTDSIFAARLAALSPPEKDVELHKIIANPKTPLSERLIALQTLNELIVKEHNSFLAKIHPNEKKLHDLRAGLRLKQKNVISGNTSVLDETVQSVELKEKVTSLPSADSKTDSKLNIKPLVTPKVVVEAVEGVPSKEKLINSASTSEAEISSSQLKKKDIKAHVLLPVPATASVVSIQPPPAPPRRALSKIKTVETLPPNQESDDQDESDTTPKLGKLIHLNNQVDSKADIPEAVKESTKQESTEVPSSKSSSDHESTENKTLSSLDGVIASSNKTDEKKIPSIEANCDQKNIENNDSDEEFLECQKSPILNANVEKNPSFLSADDDKLLGDTSNDVNVKPVLAESGASEKLKTIGDDLALEDLVNYF